MQIPFHSYVQVEHIRRYQAPNPHNITQVKAMIYKAFKTQHTKQVIWLKKKRKKRKKKLTTNSILGKLCSPNVTETISVYFLLLLFGFQKM